MKDLFRLWLLATVVWLVAVWFLFKDTYSGLPVELWLGPPLALLVLGLATGWGRHRIRRRR